MKNKGPYASYRASSEGLCKKPKDEWKTFTDR